MVGIASLRGEYGAEHSAHRVMRRYWRGARHRHLPCLSAQDPGRDHGRLCQGIAAPCLTYQHSCGCTPGAAEARTDGLSVSVMSLGGAPLGGLYRASSDADAIATIGAALSRGISHADVAPQYGQGLAEHRVGVGLAAHPGGRMTLSTKVGRLLKPATPDAPASGNWPEALPFATIYDVTPAGIRRSVLDSMRRMGGRRPDLLLLHDPDRYANGPDLIRVIAEAYQTLAALRAEGSVRAIGIGVNTPEPCHLALDLGDWDCFLLAGTYSTIRQDDRGLLDRCRNAFVSILIGGPYMSGALAGGSTWRYRPIPPMSPTISADYTPSACATACRCRRPRCSSRSCIRPWRASSSACGLLWKSFKTSNSFVRRSLETSGAISWPSVWSLKIRCR